MKYIDPAQTHGVPVFWREHAFSPNIQARGLRPGMSIAEMIEACPGLPLGFDEHGVVLVNDVVVPRSSWRWVRPKVAASDQTPIVVNFMVPLQGGSLGRTIATVALVVVAVAAIAISGGAAAPLLGAGFAAGQLGALALSAAVSVGGSLAIAALTPPPSFAAPTVGGNANAAGQAGGVASLSGNVLRPGGPIPRVVGTRRVFPPLATYPLTDLVGEDEIIEGVFILGGPHKLEDIRNADVSLSSIGDITVETREGTPTDNAALTLVTRQSRTAEPKLLLSNFKMNASTDTQLDTQGTPTNSTPYKHAFTSFGSPDEIWLSLQVTQGIVDINNPGSRFGIPFRIRMRAKGSTTWRYLPELHFAHNEAKPFQRMVKLKFAAMPASAPEPDEEKVWYLAMTRVPMRVDRVITNFADSGQAFNGDVYAGGATRGSTSGYIGADFSFYPRPVASFELWPHLVSGFVSGANTVTSISLYGKTGSSAPSHGTDGILLFTQSIGTDLTTVFRGTSNDTTTPFTYLWVNLVVSGGTMTIRGLRFFDKDGDFSWNADDYFMTATEEPAYFNKASWTTTGVKNVYLQKSIATVWLDPATFPKGDWDFEIIRGSSYRKSQFNPVYYSDVMGSEPSPTATRWVVDYFRWGYTSSNRFATAYALTNVLSDTYLTRIARVWNEPPIAAGTGNALIAVKATKRALESVNVLASGYVNRWNGTNGWTDYGISSNPADHFRDVLTGVHNADPVSEEILDDGSLTDWWHRNAAKGRTINAVMEGKTVGEALDLIAGAGLARPRFSETWGVIQDLDRSADVPVQIFTPANLRGFRWEKAYPKLPSGLRVRFDDVSDNYREKEIIVLRDGVLDDGRYEDIRYDGLVTEADARYFAARNLLELQVRTARYSGEAPAAHIMVTRGDFVGVQYDVLDDAAGWGRIVDVFKSGGLITGIALDGRIAIPETGTVGCCICGKKGARTYAQVNVYPGSPDTSVLAFTTPFSDPGADVVDADCLVATGRLAREYKRMIVASSTPKDVMTTSLVFMDEAPELHNL